MIGNRYNQIPYPAFKTKREITKCINLQQCDIFTPDYVGLMPYQLLELSKTKAWNITKIHAHVWWDLPSVHTEECFLRQKQDTCRCSIRTGKASCWNRGRLCLLLSWHELTYFYRYGGFDIALSFIIYSKPKVTLQFILLNIFIPVSIW